MLKLLKFPSLLLVVFATCLLYAQPEPASLSGGAQLDPSNLVTWGADLRLWPLATLEPKKIADGPFGEGGCVVDLDADGQNEIVVVRGSGLGSLTRFRPPEWTPEEIDTEIEMHDCIEATLFGRRGVLMIHRGAQVRFYERTRSGAWSSRDIYSIYTPSYQGGLALADIDGDGRKDILCGNYWIQSPERFELPWRLFAINTWTETERSATFSLLALDASRIVSGQAHMENARLAMFTKPADPKLQWPARMLAPDRRLADIHSLALWNGRIIAAARDQLLSIDPATGSAERLAQVSATTVLPIDDQRLALIGPLTVRLVRHSSRK